MVNTATTTPFDGWVMIAQFSRGVLLQTDIEAIDLDHQDAPSCDGEHPVARDAVYSLTSPEEAYVLCDTCVEQLVDRQAGRVYVIGALPAN